MTRRRVVAPTPRTPGTGPTFPSARAFRASEARDRRRRETYVYPPSTSRVEPFFCRRCREWACPSRSADGASCHACGAPRP